MLGSHCMILALIFTRRQFWEISDKWPNLEANQCLFTCVTVTNACNQKRDLREVPMQHR